MHLGDGSLLALARSDMHTLNPRHALVILMAFQLLVPFIRDARLTLLIPFDKGFSVFPIIVAFSFFVAAVFHAVFHFTLVIP